MKNKQELIDYVAHQLNKTHENNKNDILNNRRKILHTTITKANKNAVLILLTRKGIRYENHVKDYYFIYI